MWKRFKSLSKGKKTIVSIASLLALVYLPFMLLGVAISVFIHRKVESKKLRNALIAAVLLPALFVNTAWAAALLKSSPSDTAQQVAVDSTATPSPGASAGEASTPKPTPVVTATETTTATLTPSPTPSPADPPSKQLASRSKSSGCSVEGALADPGCTPGAIFSSATKSQVCTSGYSSSVRSVSESEKAAVYAEYGISSHTTGEYEIDHYISLELGGSNDISNLWPEAASPTPGFHEKDKVENYLHTQVCNGSMTLQEAQKEISSNWVSVYSIAFGGAASQPPVGAAAQTPTPTPDNSQSNPAVKMSTNNICHAQGDPYYDRTIHYTGFDSMQACIDAGGRPSN